MREISQSESSLPNGDSEENKPIRVYDTSGAWEIQTIIIIQKLVFH